MKKQLIKVAFRNVLKNRRRSLLNIMTFAICVFTILSGVGMIRGPFNDIYDRVINLRTGHLKIYNKAYPEIKSTMPLNQAIDNPYAVIEAIKNVPHLKAASPRLIHDGLLSNRKNKIGVLINGVDMEKEKSILTVYDNMTGEPLPADGGHILIGKAMADELSLKTGSSVLLFSQTAGNMNNLVDADVSGIYNIGFESMEKTEVYIPLAFAQKLLDMDNKATEIIIRLDNIESTDAAKKSIGKILEKQFPGLVVADWKEENADVMQLAKAKYTNMSFAIGLLLFLSFFIIVNTMSMSVFERTAEIGTLRAIGFDRKNIRDMYIYEGLFLSVFGMLAGWILAAPLVYYLNAHGIVIASAKGFSTSELPMTEGMKAATTAGDWLLSGLVCILSGVLGSYYPAMMAAKTNIVSALQKGIR
jgi:putative ABC transport system permease protein